MKSANFIGLFSATSIFLLCKSRWNKTGILLGGGSKHFLFSPPPGEMIQFDEYFWTGLKPPTRLRILCIYYTCTLWTSICRQKCFNLVNWHWFPFENLYKIHHDLNFTHWKQTKSTPPIHPGLSRGQCVPCQSYLAQYTNSHLAFVSLGDGVAEDGSRKKRFPKQKNLTHTIHVGASKNRGTPKSSILIGFFIINHPFWGTPIFGNTHVCMVYLPTLS